MTPLARYLGLLGQCESMAAYELARASLQFSADVLIEISRLRDKGFIDARVLDRVESEYRKRMGEANDRLDAIDLDPQLHFHEALVQLRRRMLQFEKSQLLEIWQQGSIGIDTYRKLMSDIDARLLEVESSDDSIPLPANEEDATD